MYYNFIKTYKSFYYNGKIFYYDILKNNIIIINIKSKKDSRGILINLNLTKKLNSGLNKVKY